MEKKVYVICKWISSDEKPETLQVLPRRDYDDKYDAEAEFVQRANSYLSCGCKIVRVVHRWNYLFEISGMLFNLYMYEQTL